jgi:hypothetical protein
MLSSLEEDWTKEGIPLLLHPETTLIPGSTTTEARGVSCVLRCSAFGKKLRAWTHGKEALCLNVLRCRMGATLLSACNLTIINQRIIYNYSFTDIIIFEQAFQINSTTKTAKVDQPF